MPYIISDILIRASSTIVIEPGTVFKKLGRILRNFQSGFVQGALKAKEHKNTRLYLQAPATVLTVTIAEANRVRRLESAVF